jgi:hypothetical protein
LGFNIYVVEIYYEQSYVKAQLIQLVRALRYVPVDIANEYGHEVLYTPPYHPELQPIELIWGIIKIRIARDPAVSISDLDAKVDEGLRAISSENWTKAYRHVQKFEDRYSQSLDDCELADDSDLSENEIDGEHLSN